VLLDDRGGIDIGDDVSISDYVNIYSHSHDIYDIHKVLTPPTRIGNGVRITYHATVLAGTQRNFIELETCSASSRNLRQVVVYFCS
jgi:galactoside O-acetyltransferase